jgi:hypothetical protein
MFQIGIKARNKSMQISNRKDSRSKLVRGNAEEKADAARSRQSGSPALDLPPPASPCRLVLQTCPPH